MKQPLVSVIMPAYNSAAYIKETIESVVAQTYENWEMLIIDDGSTDETADIIKSTPEFGTKIQYIKQANGGPGAARNNGIQRAKGEWIAFQDSDDLWAPNKLQVQMESLAEHPVDLLFSSGDFIGENIGGHFATVTGNYSGQEMFKILYKHNRIPILSVVARKSALIKAGLFNEEARFSRKNEDYELWIRMAHQGATFTGLADKLVHYRIHSGSSSKTMTVGLEADLQVVEMYNAEVSTNSPAIYRQRMRDLYGQLAAHAARMDLALAQSYISKLRPYESVFSVGLKQLCLRLLKHRYTGFYYRLLYREL